ncbi:MAG: hypothetical protein CVV30_11065 [Methanomicrobiales archaeon HGW-Methanomicrobiales-1]|jgi:hypothetical protein|nr:MAG: hypothetical protein CVV30_11065 [Methanomicrobiales archaeon HGW-Methanomicrobiales-1]
MPNKAKQGAIRGFLKTDVLEIPQFMLKCGSGRLHETEVFDGEQGLEKYRSLRVLQNHNPLISRRSQTRSPSVSSPKKALFFIFH